MASASGRKWLHRIRVLLISTGIVSIATVLKVSVTPLVSELSSSYLPPLQRSLLPWFRPPFPYLIINCIIITIAATSRLHRSRREASPAAIPDPPERVVEVGVAVGEAGGDMQAVFQDKRVVEETGGCLTIQGGGSDGDDKPEVVELDTAGEIPPISGSPVMKPPVSSRFIHRKSLSVISEGGRARRARDCERHETIEATWKAITEGRATTLTTGMRHLSSCDTWEDQERPISSLELDHSPPPENKSETLNQRKDHRQLPPPSPVNLRKEPSLSPEELNRRVEAFIEKFNEEMRLQRMESMDQLKEMMGRGL